MIVYHGTSRESAKDIIDNGVDISKCNGGYFGWAFYTTQDESLAKSNYADFAENNDGVVLSFKVSDNAKILDLSKSDDWDKYKKTDHDYHMHTLNGSLRMYKKFGIDALYDRSNDSYMFFNTKVIIGVGYNVG